MSAGSNSNLASLSISHQIQKTVHNADLFHLAMQSSHPLYKKDLTMGDYGRICAFEFSPNGSFFVTGLLQKLIHLNYSFQISYFI